MNMITTVEELYPFDQFVVDLDIVGYSELNVTELTLLRDKAYSIIRRFVGMSLEELTNTDDIQAYKDALFDIVKYSLATSSIEENEKYINSALSIVKYLRISNIDKVPASFPNAPTY